MSIELADDMHESNKDSELKIEFNIEKSQLTDCIRSKLRCQSLSPDNMVNTTKYSVEDSSSHLDKFRHKNECSMDDENNEHMFINDCVLPEDRVEQLSETNSEESSDELAEFQRVAFKNKGAMFNKFDNENGTVECQICFKNIKEVSMSQHSRTHISGKPYKCIKCSSRFTRRGDALRHYKTIHKPQSNTICSLCKHNCGSTSELIVHLKGHENISCYICDHCGCKFGKKEYYDNHIKFLHPSTERRKNPTLVVAPRSKQLKQLLSERDLRGGKRKRKSSVSPSHKNEQRNAEQNLKDACVTPQINGEDQDVIHNCTIDFPFPDDGTMKDDELVDKAIESAVCQATSILNDIQSASGNNFTTTNVKVEETKIETKSSEIQINASVGGKSHKFIVQIPSDSKIDATTQEGMDIIVSVVNNLCSGKGELDGPVEVVMQRSI